MIATPNIVEALRHHPRTMPQTLKDFPQITRSDLEDLVERGELTFDLEMRLIPSSVATSSQPS